MCGSYELRAKARELNKLLANLNLEPFDMPHGGEIHPADSVLTITGSPDGYRAGKTRWGLVGHFLDREPRSPPTTLPGEGLVSKPFYGKILKKNRCLIPATAFYECQSIAGRKQKMRIGHAQKKVLMFAGIFDHHPLAGCTCAILTTAADDTHNDIHGRMPLILDREQSAFWLDEHAEFPEDSFAELLQTTWPHPLLAEVVMEPAPSPQLSLAFA